MIQFILVWVGVIFVFCLGYIVGAGLERGRRETENEQ